MQSAKGWSTIPRRCCRGLKTSRASQGFTHTKVATNWERKMFTTENVGRVNGTKNVEATFQSKVDQGLSLRKSNKV